MKTEREKASELRDYFLSRALDETKSEFCNNMIRISYEHAARMVEIKFALELKETLPNGC